MPQTIHRNAWTIHRDLWSKQKKSGVHATALGIAEGGMPDARDRALELGLAAALGVARLTQSALVGITAQQYMSAFLVNLEPLACMYKDICDYAKRTNTRRSANTRSIEWDFKVRHTDIKINLEHFRRYQAMLADLPDENEFRRFTFRFLQAVLGATAFPAWSGEEEFSLAACPPRADARPEIHAAYQLCLRLSSLPGDEPQDRYGLPGEFPTLFWRLFYDPAAGAHPAFAGLTPPPGARLQLKPQDILDLPFWKYRWQIYELWTAVVSLSELENFGFVPKFSRNGKSMLENGRPGLVAERTAYPAAYVYVQPTYNNSNGKGVHPDLVVSDCPRLDGLAPANVHLIVEAKQQKRTLRYEAARRRNLESAHAAYTAATSNGGVILLNFDGIPRGLAIGPGAHLFGRFYPGKNYSGTALYNVMYRYLGPLMQAALDACNVVVLDYSSSVVADMERARGLLNIVLTQLGPNVPVYATVDQEFFEVQAKDALTFASLDRMVGSERAETLVTGLRALASSQRIDRAVFITDLAGAYVDDFRGQLAGYQAPDWLTVLSIAEAYGA